jgi:hypothetical protein
MMNKRILIQTSKTIEFGSNDMPVSLIVMILSKIVYCSIILTIQLWVVMASKNVFKVEISIVIENLLLTR